jgi:acetylornithine/N-succinyldiaminopimelate aminotransferase
VDVAQVQADVASYMLNTYKRPAIVFTHGKGAYLYDSTGRKYLDFLGGIAVNALGYSHRRLVRVIQREAGRAIHVSNLFHNPYQGALAKKLVQWSGMGRAFFTNSGAEAIEGALKLARAAAQQKAGSEAKKTRILALENSFHGRTFGALSITYPEKYRAPFAPLLRRRGVCAFQRSSRPRSEIRRYRLRGGAGNHSGRGRDFPGQRSFLAIGAATYRAKRSGADRRRNSERAGPDRLRFRVSAIFGRIFRDGVAAGHRHHRQAAGGGIPLGAILVSEKFAQVLSPGMHGTTFGGGPLACARRWNS